MAVSFSNFEVFLKGENLMTPLQRFLKRFEPSYCAKHFSKFLAMSDQIMEFSSLCFERPFLNILVASLGEEGDSRFGKQIWLGFSKYLCIVGVDIFCLLPGLDQVHSYKNW